MAPAGSDNEEIVSENEDELERQLAELKRKLALKKRKRTSAQSSPVQSPLGKQAAAGNAVEIPKTPPRPGRSHPYQSPLKTPPSLTRGVALQHQGSPVISSPTSPARILLGIDKGLSGWDVSLKRPPKGQQVSPLSSPSQKRNGKQPKFISSQEKYHKPSTSTQHHLPQQPQLSFAQKLKTTKQIYESQKKAAQDMRDKRREGFSIPSNAGKEQSNQHSISRIAAKSLAAAATSEDDIHEPFTNLRLSKAPSLSFDTLKEQFNDAELFNLSKLYAAVYPPQFDPPQCCNWILIGVVAKKSKVMDRSFTKGNEKPQKYIMLTLTDLGAFEVSVSLQGAAFDKYWKIAAGDVVALLNPGIYQTRKKILNNNGANEDQQEGPKTFGLFVSDASCDTILEIGKSKDLGKCAATTKMGHPCSNWVNSRKATYCDFHAEARVRKARSGRMEMNSVAQGQPMGKYGAGSSKTVLMMGNGNTFKGGQHQQGPDYANKSGLIDDPLAPKYSSVYGKVWTSTSSFAGSGSERSAFDNAFLGLGAGSTALSQKAQKAKTEKLAREREIREKLARRPDGYQLRYYDEKGNQVGFAAGSSNTSSNNGNAIDESDRPKPAFRPEHIRRIGFNPTVAIAGNSDPLANHGQGITTSTTTATTLPLSHQEELTQSILNKRASTEIDLRMNKRHRRVVPSAATTTSSKTNTSSSASPSTTKSRISSSHKMKQILASMPPITNDDDDDLEII